MAPRRKIENFFNPPKSKTKFSEGNKSAGVRDNYPVRQSISTKQIGFGDDTKKTTGEGTVHITLKTPTSSEDFMICYFKKAVTIIELRGVTIGVGTSVTINPKWDTDRSAAGTALLAAPVGVSSTAGASVSLAGGNVNLDAGSTLWLETTGTAGAPTELGLTFIFKET